MRIAILTTDNREHFADYGNPMPNFGTAPEALLQGFADLGKHTSEWDGKDLEVHVISCTRQPMVSPEKVAHNTWFHSLHVPKIGWMRTGYQGCIRAVRGKLRQIKPDIVHGQGTERDCAISAIFSGYPNVVTIHGNMAKLAGLFKARFGSFYWLTAKFEDFTLPRTCGVFCNSTHTELIVRPRSKKVWLVPNAIRNYFFRPILPRAFVKDPVILLNIGVITPNKRQVELLEMAEKLHSLNYRFRLRFIGQVAASSSYGGRFLSEVEKAGKLGYAEYAGSMNADELIASMDEASALVHFPSEEAFGLVVAEAMARNLKIFGSRSGGIVDIAHGIETAELIESGRFDLLGSAIEDWLNAGALQPEAAAGEMKVRYHPSVIAKRHLEIYREVLQMDS